VSLRARYKPHVKNTEGISNPGCTETGERRGDDPNKRQRASERSRGVEKYVALDLPRIVEAEGCHNASTRPRDEYLGESFLPAGGKRPGEIVHRQLWGEVTRAVEAI